MVERWGSPPDTNNIVKEINNLHMWCGIFKRDTTKYGVAFPGQKYWSNLPSQIKTDNFISWTIYHSE